MRSLPLFHRIAGQRIVVVGDGAIAQAKARLVERAGGICCSEAEAHHARFAFVALEDCRAARAAARRLKGKGLLVNVADQPGLCDFTLPSILERDPLLIAIGTSGASAGLAKHLRLRLEAILPPRIGALAAKLGSMRHILHEKYPSADERRRTLDAGLGEGGALDILHPSSADRVEGWLDAEAPSAAPARHEFTLASDDPDELTLGQARLLGMADLVLHDPEVPRAILNRARADAIFRQLPCDEPASKGLTVILKRA